MDGDSPAENPRSSLEFALGEFSATIANLSKEQDLQRRALGNLPRRTVALLRPELSAMAADIADHSKRITALERKVWLWIGGGLVLTTITGYVVEHLPILHIGP